MALNFDKVKYSIEITESTLFSLLFPRGGSMSHSMVCLSLVGLTKDQALGVSARLASHSAVWGFRVSDIVFTEALKSRTERDFFRVMSQTRDGKPVWVDLRLYERWSVTIERVSAFARSGLVDLVTVTAPTEFGLLRAAVKAAGSGKTNIMVATHHLPSAALVSPGTDGFEVTREVVRLAQRAKIKHLTCSGPELLALADLRKATGLRKFVPVALPAITLDDPCCLPVELAIKAGADILIVGTPITRADDPLLALNRLADHIKICQERLRASQCN